ncbi:hypothetical protein EHI8A_047950 [Entamoeba histolytica HM-1:IMSS-B]|uniref:Uncharacterized protein n=6 Tax=Entamoeba histolytica TaxID=5759 RepID=B1N3Q2_ENTH1|nr:hypothetical protein EHI_139070 [Entamoeba histolytica HM-1:IMSS]EMD43104.1 Hypothetical protein EHI5A_036000 [Entamoeba histolytica KU27]EMH76776.1 hypothetical protein EHI8A_047950 [Entamoeba histolytica HM-1:IMSS-B]EMS14870.1 hypothetical protein KM1_046070 [Entamoeba histolytica HM-3:IMSS]ENY64760.1 hypothetical protein EHI7A_020020 [Entamoeba histolytica HM-1:IMSS-A]GAT96302.1 hypothetical protein CL6EHI_139070 [Entamoeba histolytica]|eukprot:XP_001913818.1 hypothetical protein EHI_139070 [Entamoeba histolytica HM-1:IMSS]
MDITKEFHKVAFDCFKEGHKECNENELKVMFENECIYKQETKDSFNEIIKNIEMEIDKKIEMENQIILDMVTGLVDINTFSEQQSLGEQLTQWSKQMNEKIISSFETYKNNNKNKVFNIKHYTIVIDQLKDKIQKLQKKNNNQMKVIWNILNMNSELLFQLHPELLNNEKTHVEDNKKEQQEESINEPEIIEEQKRNNKSVTHEQTVKDTPVKLNASIFDDFDSDEDQTPPKEEQPELIITEKKQIPQKQKTEHSLNKIAPVQGEKITDVDFDNAWENNEEEKEEIDEEEERLLKQTENRMDDVYKVIIEKIENINDLNTKIGEMAIIQLESTQHIVDAVEEAQVCLVAGNKALEEAHQSMKSWWTPKKIAGMMFYIAGLMLLISHLTSK